MTKKVLPSTIDEAAAYLLDSMSDADKTRLKNMPKDDLIGLHFGLGMYIRNQLGLWGKNEKMMASEKSYYFDPDSISMMIIEAMWKKLQS
jgi:hypothetical protein